MSETKNELMDRLRREGRWTEASAYREKIIRECRKAGMKRADAREHAWVETAKMFPPEENELAGIANAARDPQHIVDPFRNENQPVRESTPEDFEDEVSTWESLRWAVAAVGARADGANVTRSDAPGPTAWGLFKWGLTAAKDLFSMWKAEGQRQESREDQMVRECERQNEEIREMLLDHLAECRKAYKKVQEEKAREHPHDPQCAPAFRVRQG